MRIQRKSFYKLADAAIKEEEDNFFLNLMDLWLSNYPGDLEAKYLKAFFYLNRDKTKKAYDLLTEITEIDPGFSKAQKALLHLSVKRNFKGVSRKSAEVALLAGNKQSKSAKDPKWSRIVKEAAANAKAGNMDKALKKFEKNKDLASETPLFCFGHLNTLSKSREWKQYLDKTKAYSKIWPDSVELKLHFAKLMFENGREDDAVMLMHECVGLDSTGQVAERIWGKDHSYRSLWGINFHVTIDRPIPASIIKSLGLNLLKPGNKEDALNAKSLNNNNDPQFVERIISIKEELKKVASSIAKPNLMSIDGRFPAYIGLTSKTNIIKKYGSINFEKIEKKLKEIIKLTSELSNWDAHLIYIDDLEHGAKFGFNAAKPNDAWSIKLAIAELDAGLKARGEMIGALAIIGGPEVIPYHYLPNPIEDTDMHVPSDNPYSALDNNYFIPNWSVGRIMGDCTNDPDSLLHSLDAVISERISTFKRVKRSLLDMLFGWLLNRSRNMENFGYTAEVWQRASRSVFRTIGDQKKMSVSPPLDNSQLPDNFIETTTGSYFNLHGLADSPEWFGQKDPLESPDAVDYPIALTPANIPNSGSAPKVVFSEACYGSHIIGKTVNSALSLKFLNSGTKVFVGSSCVAYGSVTTPLIAADLLGKYFWQLMQEGNSAGEALKRAKIFFAKEMHKRQGYLDGEDQKTLISFSLLGDPLTTMVRKNTASFKSIQRKADINEKWSPVCYISDHIEGMENAPIPEDVIYQVKHILKEYLPGMRGSNMQYAEFFEEFKDHTSEQKSNIVDRNEPNSQVVILSKSMEVDQRKHQSFARITLDENGKVSKIAVSR